MQLRRTLPEAVLNAATALFAARDGSPEAWAREAELRLVAKRRGFTVEFWPNRVAVPRITRIHRDGVPFRMRKVVRRSAPMQTMKTFFAKANRIIECEYFYERDAVRRFDVDWRVLSISEQPFVLTYSSDNAVRHYIPDFELRGIPPCDGLVCDVKRDDWRAKDPQLSHLMDGVEAAFAKLGIRFEIHTASHLRRQPSYGTVLELLEYRLEPVPDHERLSILRHVASKGSVRFGDLAAIYPAVTLKSLISRGKLRCDLDRPLNDQAIVSWGANL